MNEKQTSRWKPGETGNPKGRWPGQSAITDLRDSISKDIPYILASLVIAAKGGDLQAARLMIGRVLPPGGAQKLWLRVAWLASSPISTDIAAVERPRRAGSFTPRGSDAFMRKQPTKAQSPTHTERKSKVQREQALMSMPTVTGKKWGGQRSTGKRSRLVSQIN